MRRILLPGSFQPAISGWQYLTIFRATPSIMLDAASLAAWTVSNLGTGPSASWVPEYQGIVDIYCFMYDANGGELARARYHQVMIRSSEEKSVNTYKSYMKDARDALSGIREDNAVFVPGFHLAKETGITTELSLFVGQETSGTDIDIIDVTPAVPRRKYDGSDFDAALNDFNKGNSYPDGTIRLRVPANRLGIAAQDWTVTTTGESMAQRLSTVAGWESLGLAGLGALAAIIPGAEPLAPIFFLASATTGAVSVGADLYQKSLEVHPSGLGIAIDIVGLAGSLLGMAGAANILRHGPRLAALTKVGQFVLYAGFVTDAVGGVLILAQGAEEIANILDGPGNADAKAAAVTRILAGLLLNGSMLAWGAHNVKATGEQINAVVGSKVAGSLKLGEMHMLSALEGPAMSRLAGASLEEVQAIAALIQEDPVRATALVHQYGEQFVTAGRGGARSLEEIAEALHAGVPEAAGTRGEYGKQITGKVRPAYLEVEPAAGKRGESSPKGLSDRVLQVFTKPGSSVRIELAEGATLRPVGPAMDPQTKFELVIPASASRPQQAIQVTIESIPTKPTSVHGGETGPARMEIRSTAPPSGPTQYSATIQVHENLAKVDVGIAVGHELDELTFIAESGVRGSDITAQKRASLLRPQEVSGPAPASSGHDRADARAFANDVARQNIGGGLNFNLPKELVSRAESLPGFGGTAYLAERLDLLRQAMIDAKISPNVREEVLNSLRTMAVRSEVSGRLPAGVANVNR